MTVTPTPLRGINHNQNESLQRLFNDHGPAGERFICDWWRCQEQPWRGIADALAADC